VLGFVDINFMTYSFVADRFQYLACLGPFALIGAIVYGWFANARGRSRITLLTLFSVVIGVLALRTASACGIYTDLNSYWSYNVRERPESWFAHHYMGVQLARENRVDEALAEEREAIRLKPNCAQAHNDLGLLLHKKGDLDGAIAEFRDAVRCDPDLLQARNNLGARLFLSGRGDEAVETLQEALRINPDYHPARLNLARLLQKQGRMAEADVQLQEVLRRDPANTAARSMLRRSQH
jgi:tetratricopeptide (TPR) repeat protein